MTQEQALSIVRDKLPEIAEGITIVRTRSIGKQFGHSDEFVIWDHSGGLGPNNGKCSILARSQHSWEHAISLIESKRITGSTMPDRSTVDEVAAVESF